MALLFFFAFVCLWKVLQACKGISHFRLPYVVVVEGAVVVVVVGEDDVRKRRQITTL